MSKREAIIERVKKLMKLGGENPNQHEAMAAVEKAKVMMRAHDLEMADVETDDAGMEIAAAYGRKAKILDPWEGDLGVAVGKLTCTQPIYRKTPEGRTWMCFGGDPIDAKVAAELYKGLHTRATRGARAVWGSSWGRSHRSYAVGFAWGVMARSKMQSSASRPEPEDEKHAMILVGKQERVDDWIGGKKMSPPMERKTSDDIDQHAYLTGNNDAWGADLTAPGRQLEA